MEHFWTPFFTFLSGVVVAVIVPIVVWKLARAKEARDAHRVEVEEDRDYELECLRWEDYSIHVYNAFRLLFQAWRDGKDLNYPMAAMELALKSKPGPARHRD